MLQFMPDRGLQNSSRYFLQKCVSCKMFPRFAVFPTASKKKREKLLPIFPSQIGTLSKRDDAAVAFDVDVGVVSCQTR